MSRKILFVHDGPLITNKNNEVFGIHYTEEIKQRYLQLGDFVTFCMREKKINNADQNTYSPISAENFEFVPFPNFKSIKTYFSNKPKAKKIIEEQVEKHNVLVVRMPSASGTIAIKAARKLNIPYLVEMVSCTYDAYRFYNWQGRLIAPYKLKETQRIIKDCTHVLYVTKYFLQERYPTKGKSTHSSNVKLNTAPPAVLAERLTAIKNSTKPLTLGSIGVIDVKYKGQADVIKALHTLKTEGLIINYKIVGQGNPKRLQELIDQLNMNSQIEIMGALPSSEINSFLQSIAIYIQPSKTEGLPRALIEAMNMACPAAGSKVGGIPELLNADCLFEAGNSAAIAKVIRSFDINKLLQEAERNSKVAKEYQFNILEKRRKDFYKTFLKDAQLDK